MFEKEAEEIANKRCHEIMCYGHCSFSSPKHHRCGEWHREYNCAKDGAEFGYNKAKVEVEDSYRESLCNSELNLASVTEQLEELEKANEWHYVKDGKLDDVIDTWDKKRKYLIMARFTNNLGEYDEVPLLAYFDHCFSQKWCTSKLDYLSKFYITWWKEIVLPELKESE